MKENIGEQELARLCSGKDDKAAGELYTRYAARLLTLCRRYCSDSDEAEDLMQDALIRALDNMSTFTYRGNGSLYAWISRIAVNMALSRIRKHRLKLVSLSSDHMPDIPDPGEEEMMRVPQDRLLEMISSLTDVRRVVFNMYCIDGYSHREIAQALGISEKGSASTLAKARNQLKKEIRDYLDKTE